MDRAAIASTEDIELLRTMLLEQLHINAKQTQALTSKDVYIAKLKAENARLRRLQFAARSEKLSAEQRDLFQEILAEEIAAVEAELDKLETPVIPQRALERTDKPRKRGLPDHLPRVETRHEPATCTCEALREGPGARQGSRQRKIGLQAAGVLCSAGRLSAIRLSSM
jgi:hypothetical protein